MKRFSILFISCLLFLEASAQFEQKLSLFLSPGAFKTLGEKVGEYDPFQFPNYRPGYSVSGGLQYHLTPRFSVVLQATWQHCGNWYYDGGGEYNYLRYSIYDSTEVLLGEGYNALDLTNISISLVLWLFSLNRSDNTSTCDDDKHLLQ